MQGFVHKKAVSLSKQSWKVRWLVLAGQELRYYERFEDDAAGTRAKAALTLLPASTVKTPAYFHAHEVEVTVKPGTVLYFYTDTKAEQQKWVDALRAVLLEIQPARPAARAQPLPFGGAGFIDDIRALEAKAVAAVKEKSKMGFFALVNAAMAKSGRLVMWGSNTDGLLGDDHKDRMVHASPAKVPAFRTRNTPVMVSTAARHAAAIDFNTQLYVWGNGSDGQLGLGPRVTESLRPHLVISLRDKVVSFVSCGFSHTLAVADGRAFAWGSGPQGQLGLGDVKLAPTPTPIPALCEVPVRRVFAGREVSLAACAGSGAFVWGCGRVASMCLRRDDVTDVPVPELVPGTETTHVSSAALADSAVFLLAANGRLTSVGQLSAPGTTSAVVTSQLRDGFRPVLPFAVVGGTGAGSVVTPVQDISACGTVALAVAGGEVWAKGSGCLGTSHEDEFKEFRVVEGLRGLYIARVVCGQGFSVALSCFGDAYSWGSNSCGQLMHGTHSAVGDVAPCVGLPGMHFSQVSLSGNTGAAIMLPGTRGIHSALEIARVCARRWIERMLGDRYDPLARGCAEPVPYGPTLRFPSVQRSAAVVAAGGASGGLSALDSLVGSMAAEAGLGDLGALLASLGAYDDEGEAGGSDAAEAVASESEHGASATTDDVIIGPVEPAGTLTPAPVGSSAAVAGVAVPPPPPRRTAPTAAPASVPAPEAAPANFPAAPARNFSKPVSAPPSLLAVLSPGHLPTILESPPPPPPRSVLPPPPPRPSAAPATVPAPTPASAPAAEPAPAPAPTTALVPGAFVPPPPPRRAPTA